MAKESGQSEGGLSQGGPIPVVLPTTVVGSYSVPEWLERLKTEYYQRRISASHLAEIHDVAIKAAVKDQELAGIDIVSDGELRRDNDIDYFLARMPGVHIPQRAKADYYDYYDAEVSRPLPAGEAVSLGLAADFGFTRQLTDHPVKFSFTGPFSLSRRIRNDAYTDPGDLVRALARRLNAEARDLANAGAGLLQIDEPFLAGYPEQVELRGRGGQHRHRGSGHHVGAARVLRQPVLTAVMGGPLRFPVPGGDCGRS